MVAWIVPSNPGTFDMEAAFRAMQELHWSEVGNSSIAVGEVVYLYSSSPISAVTHKCLVLATRVPANELIDDAPFWRDPDAFAERVARRSWMRLRLIRTFDQWQRPLLSLPHLAEHGLRGTMSGRQRLPESARDYIARVELGDASNDAVAESAEFDESELVVFTQQIDAGEFAVLDRYANMKTRGSAQRAFADAVKRNYGSRCAIAGIATPAFLVASHIVPWSVDEQIRLDPSNGICLSTIVDRAFDTGYLSIGADYVVVVERHLLTDDPALDTYLSQFDGQAIRVPTAHPPSREYLSRRLSTAHAASYFE